jgi:hypothetical protein
VRIFAIANEELARLGCGYAIFVKKFLKSYIAAFGIALSPARVYRMWQRLSPQTTFTRIAGFLFLGKPRHIWQKSMGVFYGLTHQSQTTSEKVTPHSWRR